MNTYFASPERASKARLHHEVELVSHNPVIDGLMNSVGGLLAVLNKHRQILALNESIVDTLGITNVSEVLGVRPGEALKCIHSDKSPAGCGTSEQCATCGVTIAIIESLTEDKPVERTCALQTNNDGVVTDRYLNIRACPITLGRTHLVLLFLQDVTREHLRATLEHVFFHDVSNTLTGLLGTSELLLETNVSDKGHLLQQVQSLSLRLVQEIEMQRKLVRQDRTSFVPRMQTLSLEQVIQEICHASNNHPAALSKSLVVDGEIPVRTFQTDLSILLRILGNMVTNAFEATKSGGQIRLSVEDDKSNITFSVWNDTVIPKHITKRIFQRYYSTKPGEGRGLGTYSMKLFGEQFLGGEVSMQSLKKEGTTFRFRLPV